MPASRENWHLDKRVPIAFFIGLIVQTVVITAWFTTKFDNFDSRLAALEKSDDSQANHENRITILEQKWEYIRGDLTEIKGLLQRRLPEPPRAP